MHRTDDGDVDRVADGRALYRQRGNSVCDGEGKRTGHGFALLQMAPARTLLT
jgi:ribosomal protein L27